MGERLGPAAAVVLSDLTNDPSALASLYRIAEVVNADLDLDHVLQAVTDEATSLVGARYGAFFSNAAGPEGDEYQLYTLSGAEPEGFTQLPKPRATPIFGPTFHGLGALRLDDVTTDPRYGLLPPHYGMPNGHPPVRSYLAVPVVARSGEVLGGLFFGHPDVGVFGERDERIAGVVGWHAALAADKARRFDEEQQARRDAEATTVRLSLLQRLTAEMVAARDTAQVASVLVTSAGDGLGAVSTILYVPADNASKLVTAGPHTFHADRVDRWTPMDIEADLPVAEAYRTRSLVFAGSRPDREQRWPVLAENPNPLVEGLVVLPLLASSEVVGVLAFGWSEVRSLPPEEQDFLAALAHQCAQALERAQLYESLAEMASTLQASLLPPNVHPPTGLELATRYRPVQRGAQVGGDFYDVFPVAPGRWGVVIGDVSGKGVRAASLTALVRHTVRVAARNEPNPAQVLGVLNDELLEARDDHFCTVAYLEVAPEPGRCRVRMALAGHPPPLLRAADGEVRPVGVPGMAVGLVPMAEVTDADLELAPGDTLVLFTDGVVEARDPDGHFGDELLHKALVGAAPDADSVADEVVHGAVQFAGGEPRDDIAAVVLRVPAGGLETAASQVHSVDDLPPVPDSISRARDAASEFAEAHGFGPLRDTTSLLTSELVTNAIRHAGTSICLRLVRRGERLRVEVSDGSRARPVRRRFAPDVDAGRGLNLLERLAVDWGVRRTPEGKTVWFELVSS